MTHVVNCRPRAQVRWWGDLAAERAMLVPAYVRSVERWLAAGAR